MKKMLSSLSLFTFVLLVVLPICSQQTREQAVAGMRKVEPKEIDPTYSTPAPFAKQLINEALSRHPQILLIAIHAQPPGHPNLIVASNFGRIGKIGDADDMRCINTGKPNLEVNGKHYEVELPLLDSSGRTLGALGVVFNYKPGDNKQIFLKIATATRDEMQHRISSNATLFSAVH